MASQVLFNKYCLPKSDVCILSFPDHTLNISCQPALPFTLTCYPYTLAILLNLQTIIQKNKRYGKPHLHESHKSSANLTWENDAIRSPLRVKIVGVLL